MSINAIKITLKLAAIYNVAWGSMAIMLPIQSFEVLGMPPPLYPQLWQCIGMIVGVYGLGYCIAASDPVIHWPIVLVGFLGKILGPIGFAAAIIKDELPLIFGVHVITNDLIWWIPFFLILKHVYTKKIESHMERIK